MAEQLMIVQFPRGWSIFVRGQWRGRFDVQVDAVSAALQLLNDLNHTGADVSLVIQDRFGELRAYDEGHLRREPEPAPGPPAGATAH